MDSKNGNYGEGCSMQRPPLLEAEGFWYWKQRFETYVCAKDVELWDRIENGDYVPNVYDPVDKKFNPVGKSEWNDDHKKKVAKNFEAKIILYNALPRSEYERVFMCKSAKEAWDSLVITHQGNTQVIENKVDLLVAQYESFTFLEDEKIDVGFSRFNTICTSLKALGTNYTPKQCMRKFLRALPSKWRAKVTAIDEAQDFDKLTMDQLVGNLKVYEVILEKDEEIAKIKKEKFKSIALKAKTHEEPINDEEEEPCEDEDEELAMMVRSFKRIFQRRGKFVRPPMNDGKRPSYDPKKKQVRKCCNCGDPNHMISDCPNKKNERAYFGGAWDDEDDDDQDETQEQCSMALVGISLESDNEESYLEDQCKDEVSPNSFLSLNDLEHDYEKLINLSELVSNKNKSLKLENKSLRDELEKQKSIVNNLTNVTQKGKLIACLSCEDHELKIENLTNKIVKLEKQAKIHKSEDNLNNILKCQRSSHDKSGLGYTQDKEQKSNNLSKHIIFVNSLESVNSSTKVNKGLENLSKMPKNVESPKVINKFYSQKSRFGITLDKNHNNLEIKRRPFQHDVYQGKNNTRYLNHHNSLRRHYKKPKIVKRWIKVGMFSANNPGPMRHWVPY